MASFLDRYIPAHARRLARSWMDAPGRTAIRKELARRSFIPPPGDPVLSFGGVSAADSDGVVHGGRVKLLHLQEAFPVDGNRFNILYLISSALPPHAAEVALWAKKNGALVVLNQNGVAFPAWAGTGYLSYNRPTAEVLALADFVFYQSEFCRTSADLFLGAAAGGSQVAFNCVDTERFCPAAEPASPGEGAPLRLLVTGTHEQGYRVLVAIEALSFLWQLGTEAHLTIAGRFTWPGGRREVEQRIQALGLRGQVTLRGSFKQEEAPGIYQGSDILLHLKYADPCPTVPIEAMACGLPVVGSATGGLPELVPAEAGRLIPVASNWEKEAWPSPAEVAGAVEELAAGLSAHRSAAREHAVKQFGRTDWVEQHRTVFHQVLKAS